MTIDINIPLQVFLPPTEAYTPMIQVTDGCSYNRCNYCKCEGNENFRILSDEEIDEQIREISQAGFPFDKVYLVGGDPFVIETNVLLNIFDMISESIPSVQEFSMYASIRNLELKTDDELKILKERGVNSLYIGLDSGDASALKFANKGYDSDVALYQLKRLEKIGIIHSEGIMLGLMGKGNGVEVGKATGKFLSKLNPMNIWATSVAVMPKTKLWNQIENGEFEESSIYEDFEEMEAFLKEIHVENRVYFSYMPNSRQFQFQGCLPEDQERLIRQCRTVLDNYTPEKLDQLFERSLLRKRV